MSTNLAINSLGDEENQDGYIESFNHNKSFHINEYSNTVVKNFDGDNQQKETSNAKTMRDDFEAWYGRKVNSPAAVQAANSGLNDKINPEQIVKLVSRIDAARIAVAQEQAYAKDKEQEFEKLKQIKLQEKQSEVNSPMTGSISNFFPNSPSSRNESEKEKKEKAEKFEKFLGTNGVRVSMYVPTTDSEDGGISTAKIVAIRYDKATESLLFENKVSGQYQRLKLNVVKDIISVQKGFGEEVIIQVPGSENKGSKFLNFKLNGSPDINVEFQSADRCEIAFQEFSRLLEVKKANPLTPSHGQNKNESFLSVGSEDSVSSFLNSRPKLDSSFYINTVKASKNLHVSVIWFKWLGFIPRDAFGSSPAIFKSTVAPRDRLVVVSTGGIVSYFKLHQDFMDPNIYHTLEKFKKGLWDKQVLLDFGYTLEGSFQLNTVFKMSFSSKGDLKYCMELLFKGRVGDTILNISFSSEADRLEGRKVFEENAV